MKNRIFLFDLIQRFNSNNFNTNNFNFLRFVSFRFFFLHMQTTNTRSRRRSSSKKKKFSISLPRKTGERLCYHVEKNLYQKKKS